MIDKDEMKPTEKREILGYGLKPLREKTLSSNDLVNVFIRMTSREVQTKAKQLSSELHAESGNERAAEYLEGLK